ncbi:D-alanyl-lipoteichoic acid biosynthesis protein DltB, partial [Lactobacillus salivarius]|nr:D-alanyl-lipoteichoic acid biosynthesis protein DltB [Ligilactobacillus salivarius]
LICYIIYEMILTFGYFNYRKKKNSGVIFVLAVILSILPLVIVKITPAIDAGKESIIGFLGISYLTFKTVGMIMEIRDGII